MTMSVKIKNQGPEIYKTLVCVYEKEIQETKLTSQDELSIGEEKEYTIWQEKFLVVSEK